MLGIINISVKTGARYSLICESLRIGNQTASIVPSRNSPYPSFVMNRSFAALLSSISLLTGADAVVVISEFAPNPTGTDPGTQMIELSGNPNEAYSGFISTIETDDGAALGTIDRQTMIAGNLDGNGIAVVSVGDLENPSFTLVFHSADAGGTGADLDTNDDSTLDLAVNLGTIFDAISIPDEVADQGRYGVQLGGQDFTFTGDEPQLVFRDGTTGGWLAVNDPDTGVIDINGNNVGPVGFASPSFGSSNPAIPEPSSSLLGVLGLLAVFGHRRRK